MNPDKLFDYLEGKLSPADRAQLEEQLMSDPQLRRQFEVARGIHRAGRDTREVVVPSEDHAAVERSGRLGRRIATVAAALVLINVLVGLAVIFGKNKKPSNLGAREAEIRQQLQASLDAAAEKAMPPPSFTAGEILISAPRSEWEKIAERILAAAVAFGGTGAKGLPEENVMTVLVDVPASREAEFRRAVESASKQTPMPAIEPGPSPPDETAKDRTIVQIRIAEAAR